MHLAVINQKGGTGKTTTSIHLAAGLAAKGRKSLLIDNDPQGSVATSLNLDPGQLRRLLLCQSTLPDSLQEVSPGFWVLSASQDLMEVETQLHRGELNRLRLYSEALEDLHDFDFVIFDMAPSRSLLNEAALFFCHEILIPVSCDYLALVGVKEILDFIDQINRQKSSPLGFQGLLPTFYDTRSRLSPEAVEMLEKHFPQKVFSPIRQSTKAKEAPSFGQTLFEYAPRSTTARDYTQFIHDFLKPIG